MSFLFLQKVGVIPAAMLLIWKNFLFGPDGQGRNRFALIGICLIAVYCMVTAFVEGAKIDTYFSGNFAFWFVGLFAVFAWIFALPAAIFLIDKSKTASR